MIRYELIHTKMPREFILLQGTGCKWKRCTFCDYYSDYSDKPFETNREVLAKVTGKYGVLDIINSGSCLELDTQTIELIKEVVKTKNIHTLWFESHYMYRNKLSDFANKFENVSVKFRCGIESFDAETRQRWNKGVDENVMPKDVAQYFKGVCLLCCVKGDTRKRIISDIEIAKHHFEYFSINLFCNNTTPLQRDEELAEWFKKEVMPSLADDDRIEILLNNTDLGVGA